MMPKGTLMGRQILDASFDEWIGHVFEHSSESDDWILSDEFPSWNVPPSKTVAFLNATFEKAGSTLKNFSDAQIANGLKYIYSPHYSDIAFSLRDETVPLGARTKCLGSLHNLYSDCFATRCTPILSHLDEEPDTPLNGVCYMWWDVFPIHDKLDCPDCKEIHTACLTVMESVLQLESDACRESALHGLGHWAYGYPEFVAGVIDRFIGSNSNIRPELITYAHRASRGDVL